jgi:hypothetical protein
MKGEMAPVSIRNQPGGIFGGRLRFGLYLGTAERIVTLAGGLLIKKLCDISQPQVVEEALFRVTHIV